MRIAKVVVDLSLNKEFDYLVPPELDIRLGDQVIVPFGRSTKRGHVTGFADSSEHENLKTIRERVGKKPLVDPAILKLAQWMAEYYCAPIEQALSAVLPSAVRKKGPAFKERLFAIPTDAAKDAELVKGLRKKSPKQAAVLDTVNAQGPKIVQDVARAVGVDSATVRALERKGFVRIASEVQQRDPHAGHDLLRTEALPLMPQQEVALAMVRNAIDTLKPGVVLLHGSTGSGKTEIYLQAIDYVLKQGKGAIVLVPEIALTPQTVDRFRSRFGDITAVLHSSLSEGERHDEWHRVHSGSARIAIGARSALFAPMRDLGLIVVDEEHEPTYKQDDSIRYQARDVAVMRGHMEGCAVVLGSATPSLESWNNALRKKYALASMPLRVDNQKMPLMRVIDMRSELAKEGKINVLSGDLCEAIRSRLNRTEQTMLFLNRRGYASSLVCPKCGYVATCDQCSVSLTFHKPTNRLVCHMCGSTQNVPQACPNVECRDPAFKYSGMGTQRVEDVLAKVFPKARVHRMDSDTMTRKDSYRKTLGDFRSGKIDILVGTQMIAKGLHFPNVTLVGVINADLGLHMPDFRAGERTFQLLTQVAGRAGRGDVVGEVIVQTFTPFHPAIQAARRMDFDGFCDQELEFRKELGYPPFTHLICMTIRGAVEEKVSFSALTFLRAVQPKFDKSVMVAGPTPAPVARIKGEHRYQIIMRADRAAAMTGPLRDVLKTFTWPEDVQWSLDVDAQQLL